MSAEIMRMSEINENTPILIETSEKMIQMSVRDVIRWVAPAAPPDEALKFLLTCRTAKLNPFLQEAYLIPMGGRWATVISKSGYLKRAQQHPDYDGHESGIIAQSLDPKTNARGPLEELVGNFMPQGWVVVGGWAKVYKKGISRPTYIRVSIKEYYKDTHVWKTITCTMIRKVALVQAIREAFAIGDSYDASEVSDDRPVRVTTVADSTSASLPAIEAKYAEVEEPSLPPDLLQSISDVAKQLGMSDEDMKNVLFKRGVNHVAELSREDGVALLRKMQERLEEKKFREAPEVMLAAAGAAVQEDGAATTQEVATQALVEEFQNPAPEDEDEDEQETIADGLILAEIVKLAADLGLTGKISQWLKHGGMKSLGELPAQDADELLTSLRLKAEANKNSEITTTVPDARTLAEVTETTEQIEVADEAATESLEVPDQQRREKPEPKPRRRKVEKPAEEPAVASNET